MADPTNAAGSSELGFDQILVRLREVVIRLESGELSLEQSLEFCREDECVEVTPDAIRMRKVALTQLERAKLGRKSKS